MYNRYIPQPDGSFQRRRMQDSRPKQPEHPPVPPEPPCPPECHEEAPPCPPPQPEQRSKPRPQHHRTESVGGFLQQLLPKNFDTGDLIVVLLLLLLADDCEEDRGHALLTLALYLFM